MKKSARQVGARQKRWRKKGFAQVAIAVESDSTAAANYWQDEALVVGGSGNGAAKTNPGCWLQVALGMPGDLITTVAKEAYGLVESTRRRHRRCTNF
jgi:hypothetical protein